MFFDFLPVFQVGDARYSRCFSTGCISGQSPSSQNWGLKESVSYPRSNMTGKGKQQLSKTLIRDKSMRLVLGLFKSAGIVLWIAREASMPCAPKHPREGKPQQVPLWLFSSPRQNKKRSQLKKNRSSFTMVYLRI